LNLKVEEELIYMNVEKRNIIKEDSMNHSSGSQSINRRNFLKLASLATVGTSGLLVNRAVAAPASRSTVVLVRHKGAVQNDGRINQKVVNDMLAQGLIELSSTGTLVDAWQSFIPSKDRVGIKINTLGLEGVAGINFTDHFSGVTTGIVDGLKKAGTEEQNIIICDRRDSELIAASLKLQKKEGQLRVMGTKGEKKELCPGYDKKEMAMGKKTVHLSRILTHQNDSLINVSLLKDHMMAGITGSLKNHYGTIDNPMPFHWHNCTDPGIPELNLIESIRKKQRLCICDALMGVYDGGPMWKTRNIFTYGGLLFATDPVAMDAVHFKLINEQRKKKGENSIKKNKAKHIALSGDLGLGVNKLENIDLKEIVLS
jgi:uncharacterized protein (DUF362 family)